MQPIAVILAKMASMNRSQRQRIIDDLTKLAPNEFDALLSEVRERRGVEAAGVAALREALAARLAESPFSPLSGLEPISPDEHATVSGLPVSVSWRSRASQRQ